MLGSATPIGVSAMWQAHLFQGGQSCKPALVQCAATLHQAPGNSNMMRRRCRLLCALCPSLLDLVLCSRRQLAQLMRVFAMHVIDGSQVAAEGRNATSGTPCMRIPLWWQGVVRLRRCAAGCLHQSLHAVVIDVQKIPVSWQRNEREYLCCPVMQGQTRAWCPLDTCSGLDVHPTLRIYAHTHIMCFEPGL